MTDKKAINALDPENTPAADDLLYLRKGGGSNVDRKVVLPADSVLRRSVGTGADEVPDNSLLGSASGRDVGTGADEVPDNDQVLADPSGSASGSRLRFVDGYIATEEIA